MSTQKVIISGIAGGVVYFLLGWLIYGMLIHSFMMSHQGTALMVSKSDKEMMEPMMMMYMLAGNMALGFLLAIIFGRWANITTMMTGLISGAVIGFLVIGGLDCITYASTNVMSRKGIAVDIIAFTVLSAIAGGVVAWILGMGKKAVS